MKIFHIVENLDRGAVENWLVRMLAHARQRTVPVDWTFYCTTDRAGSMDSLARSLGANIVYSPVPIAEKRAFLGALRAELKRGRYDILHSHHDLISAVYLTATLGLPVRRRLVHVHNADEFVLTPSPIKQAIFRPLFRALCLALADKIVANSNHTLDYFLRGRPRIAARDIVHYYGIDPARFGGTALRRAEFRTSAGIAQTAPVLLFAGRMVPEKNPVFTVDVLAALRKQMPDAVGVFAGDGSLMDAVRDRAAILHQTDAIRLLGWRDDVAEIMSASDWFILPHPHEPPEGFGIAVVEAQLAGLKLLLSEGVRDDPLLPNAVYRRLSLDAGPEAWSNAAREIWTLPRVSQKEAEDALHHSPMDMDNALRNLLALYA